MKKAVRLALAVFASMAVALSSLLVVSAPASASGYDTYTYSPFTVKCPCKYNDPWDYTYFRYDHGGKARKIELWLNGRMRGKIEFHPYGEHLYVYDTYKDGWGVQAYIQNVYGEKLGAYNGRSQGYRFYNLSYSEGYDLIIKAKVYKNAYAPTIASFPAVA